jgi:hypothetical protein
MRPFASPSFPSAHAWPRVSLAVLTRGFSRFCPTLPCRVRSRLLRRKHEHVPSPSHRSQAAPSVSAAASWTRLMASSARTTCARHARGRPCSRKATPSSPCGRRMGMNGMYALCWSSHICHKITCAASCCTHRSSAHPYCPLIVPRSVPRTLLPRIASLSVLAWRHLVRSSRGPGTDDRAWRHGHAHGGGASPGREAPPEPLVLLQRGPLSIEREASSLGWDRAPELGGARAHPHRRCSCRGGSSAVSHARDAGEHFAVDAGGASSCPCGR